MLPGGRAAAGETRRARTQKAPSLPRAAAPPASPLVRAAVEVEINLIGVLEFFFLAGRALHRLS